MLTESQCTRSKELEIYRQLWSSPGEQSAISHIIAYCQRNNIGVVGLTVDSMIEQIIAPDTDPTGQKDQLYAFFKQSMPNLRGIASPEDSDLFFPEGTTVLIVMLGGDHIVFGTKKEGKLEVSDNERMTTYSGVADFISQEKQFTGVFSN